MSSNKEKTFPIREYGFTIKKAGKNFILCDNETTESLYTFSKRALTSEKVKEDIKFITGADDRTLNIALAEIAKSEGEPKSKEVESGSTLKDSGVSDQGYFEAIYHEGKPCFLVLKDKEFAIFETVSYNGKTFNPKEANRIPYEAYSFFQGEIPNREDLFWKVREEFQRFIDVESIWFEVLSACVLLSYQQEKLVTVPYIFVYGDNESGKSTVLQLLKFLCYRPMYGVTVPAADIYGYLEDINAIGCVLEDEIQGIDKDTDKIKIYKAGYKEGAVVPRTIITQYDRKIIFYNTFCFKACASERIPSVKGFRERFIEISMVEGFPEKEWTDITEEDLKRLYDLRNMFLKWRMLSREWPLPNPTVSMRGRLKELWKPILQITHGLTIYDTLANFVEEQRNERLSTKQNTLEGHIVKVVVDIHNQDKKNLPYIPFKTIWDALAEDLEGKIDDNKPHVMDTSEFFRVTKSRVGYRLREVLSGKSKTVRQKIPGEEDKDCPRIKAYEFNQDKLRRIAKKYGYELVTKLLTEPTSEGVQASKSTLKDSEKSVEKDVDTPKELGVLGNSVTKPKSIDEMFSTKKPILTEDSLQKVLSYLPDEFEDGVFQEIAIGNLGVTREEANQLFSKLVDEGKFARDNNGFWSRV